MIDACYTKESGPWYSSRKVRKIYNDIFDAGAAFLKSRRKLLGDRACEASRAYLT